jgi:hypothetical protein
VPFAPVLEPCPPVLLPELVAGPVVLPVEEPAALPVELAPVELPADVAAELEPLFVLAPVELPPLVPPLVVGLKGGKLPHATTPRRAQPMANDRMVILRFERLVAGAYHTSALKPAAHCYGCAEKETGSSPAALAASVYRHPAGEGQAHGHIAAREGAGITAVGVVQATNAELAVRRQPFDLRAERSVSGAREGVATLKADPAPFRRPVVRADVARWTIEGPSKSVRPVAGATGMAEPVAAQLRGAIQRAQARVAEVRAIAFEIASIAGHSAGAAASIALGLAHTTRKTAFAGTAIGIQRAITTLKARGDPAGLPFRAVSSGQATVTPRRVSGVPCLPPAIQADAILRIAGRIRIAAAVGSVTARAARGAGIAEVVRRTASVRATR